MSHRPTQTVQPLPKKELEAVVEEFRACALAGLDGQVSSQRKLAIMIGWAESTVSSALKGRFNFKSWPWICRALGLDPIDTLVRGREALRHQRERAHEQRQMAQAAVFHEMLEGHPDRDHGLVLEKAATGETGAPFRTARSGGRR